MDVNYSTIGADTYYVIKFNKEVGFVMVNKFEKKDAEKIFDKDFKYLNFRLSRLLDKWVDALEDMETCRKSL